MTGPAIVVGVDESWQRSGALDWAVHEALLSAAPLVAVHILDGRLRWLSYATPGGTATVDIPLDAMAEHLLGQVTAYIDKNAPGLDLTVRPLAGEPAQVLAELGDTARMLVLGRRGDDTIGRLLIGATSDSVAQQARCPVVVVPDGWKTTDHLAEQVVAGVDSPTPRDAALRFAVEFASAHGAGVQMVHVWTVPAAYAWDYPARRRIREQVAAMAQRHLDDVVREWRLRYPQVQLSSELRRAHRVLGLIDAARDAGAQLIVVGGHPRDDRHPPMLGPVARGVLHHAACPVAVVHEHHDDVEGTPPEVHGRPTQRGDR